MNPFHQMRLALAGLMLAALTLAGCAGPGSYVVLLPSPDGTVGKVTISGASGQQVLTQARTGSMLNGKEAPFEVSREQLAKDFGEAMSARPALPEHFLLYFMPGGAQLTPLSVTLLPKILQRAKARHAVDVSVIGHTDTQGKAETNEALALKRAAAIAEQLRQMGLKDTVISVESHGERNLLVPTPDETAEPRNRRVEITLR